MSKVSNLALLPYSVPDGRQGLPRNTVKYRGKKVHLQEMFLRWLSSTLSGTWEPDGELRNILW